MSEKMNAIKVNLSSGKVVHLREMRIRDQELAAKAVGSKAGDNQFVFATMQQSEIIKLLILDIDGKKPSPSDIENLDKLFSLRDYRELSHVVKQLMGDDDMGKVKTEIASFGNT